MEETRCWEYLHDPQHSGELDAEAVLNLAKAAGYDERTAEKWAKERALQRLRNDLPA